MHMIKMLDACLFTFTKFSKKPKRGKKGFFPDIGISAMGERDSTITEMPMAGKKMLSKKFHKRFFFYPMGFLAHFLNHRFFGFSN